MSINQTKERTFILTLGFLLMSSGLHACSCIGEKTVKEEIKHADAVLVGKIISEKLVEIEDSMAIKIFNSESDTVSRKTFPYKMVIAQFELVVTSRYKGKITSDTVQIYTGLGGGDCGVRFEIGKEYIVYGKNDHHLGQTISEWQYPHGTDIYWTDICSRTTVKNEEEISGIEKFRRKKKIVY